MMGLGPIGAVLFLLLAAAQLPRLVSLFIALEQDVARTLVLVAVRALPPEQADWGRAMVAELDHIESRRARLRFALGCVRTAATRPPLLAVAVVAASLALGGLVAGQLAGPDLGPVNRAWQVATVVEFAAFACAAVYLSADAGPHRGATRRLGVACGVAVSALLYVRPVLELLHQAAGATGGAGILAGGPAVLVPVGLGIAGGWIGRSGPAAVRTAMWAALATCVVWMGGIILATVTLAQSLNDRTENAVIWFVFPLLSVGYGFVVGLPRPGWEWSLAAQRGRVGCHDAPRPPPAPRDTPVPAPGRGPTGAASTTTGCDDRLVALLRAHTTFGDPTRMQREDRGPLGDRHRPIHNS